MPESLQHILVYVIIAGCVGFLLWQAFGGLLGRRSRLGKCCDAGCNPKPTPTSPAAEHFLPVERLARKK